MRDISQLPITLTQHNNPLRGGGEMGDLTRALIHPASSGIGSWRRTIRSIGGYHYASATMTGTDEELLTMFGDGLGSEIRETIGSIIYWQGFNAAMKLTYKGQLWEKRW